MRMQVVAGKFGPLFSTPIDKGTDHMPGEVKVNCIRCARHGKANEAGIYWPEAVVREPKLYDSEEFFQIMAMCPAHTNLFNYSRGDLFMF